MCILLRKREIFRFSELFYFQIFSGSGTGKDFRIRIYSTDRKTGDLSYLDEELAAAVAEELMEANLDLEGGNLVLLKQFVVSRRHERVRLRARQRAAQHVTQRNVLEA